MKIARLPVRQIVQLPRNLRRLLLAQVLGEDALDRRHDLLLRGERIRDGLDRRVRVRRRARALEKIHDLPHLSRGKRTERLAHTAHGRGIFAGEIVALVFAEHRIERIAEPLRLALYVRLLLLSLADRRGGELRKCTACTDAEHCECDERFRGKERRNFHAEDAEGGTVGKGASIVSERNQRSLSYSYS